MREGGVSVYSVCSGSCWRVRLAVILRLAAQCAHLMVTTTLDCKESRGDMLNFCSPDTLFPGGSDGNLPAAWETRVRFLGWEDPLEKGMAIHSSILAWRIPQTVEPGGLQYTRSQPVGQD